MKNLIGQLLVLVTLSLPLAGSAQAAGNPQPPAPPSAAAVPVGPSNGGSKNQMLYKARMAICRSMADSKGLKGDKRQQDINVCMHS